jgi:hypothetical protein
MAGAAPVAAAIPDPANSPPAGSPPGERCPSCGAPRESEAPFCESCGHDFVSGAPKPAATASTSDNTAVVDVDREYFDAQGSSSGLQFPDPRPPSLAVPLSGDEILIGRHSETRAINPQIDLSGEHDDPAVSHRHAILRRSPNGWTVTDLGSTNGTRIDPAQGEITPGQPIDLPRNGRFYIGAWTSITLEHR